MSRFSDSGCFAQIIVIAIFLGIFGIYNACENSEWMMMREARKSSDASSYSRYLKKYPHVRYIKEAEDSVFSICCRKRKFDDYINMFSQGRYIQSTDDTLFVICKQKGLFDEYNELNFRKCHNALTIKLF